MSCAGSEEILIPLRCCVPAFILYKGIITAEIHGQRLAAVRTGRKKLGRDFHIFLPLDHFADHSFVIKGFLTARLTALEQAVIALRVKKPLFVKASLLKAMVNIRGDDKIIFVLYQLKKVLIDRLRRILIAVDVDIPAPIRPPTAFRLGDITENYENPVRQAEYLYSLIESEVK